MNRIALLISPLALAACSSVLGIEELHEDARPGSDGAATNSGGSANDAGNHSGSGASNGGANNASGSSAGGTSSSSAGSSNPGGGNNPAGGSNGSAGSGGSAEPKAGPVHGTLIDFWGRGLANVTLQIGPETTATDRDGKFSIESDVPAEYDASLKLEREAGDKVYGWVYQGLTRRDPTLQVYEARDDHDTDGYVTITSEEAPGTNDTISGAWGTADGTYEKQGLTTSQNGNYFDPKWQGAASIMGTAHALLWSKNAATELPTAYKSYASKLIALEASTDPSMDFELKSMTIASANLTGSVSPVGAGTRKNSVFVRFKSGAALTLASHTPSDNAFSYLVPQLADASISVAASEVDSSEAFSIVHKDGLSPGASVGELAIPAPPAILGPSGVTAEAVDATTTFSFRGSADSPGGYVVHIEADKFYQSLFIVTQKTSFTLPEVLGGGYTLTSGRTYRWWVETHGSLKTVDQMAEAGGFADAYSGPTQLGPAGVPMGLEQESGSYTSSGAAFFTLK